MKRFRSVDNRVTPADGFIWVLLLTTLALGLIAACDQSRPLEIAACAPSVVPEVIVDKAAKTVTVIDPSLPGKPLVIRVDESNHTQSYEYGAFTLVSGRSYVTAYTGEDLYEVSWEEMSDTRYRERYYVNGAVLDLEIDGAATEDQVQDFVEFYTANDTGLGNHPDVTAMADLLQRAQPELVRLIRESNPDAYGPYASGSVGDELEMGMPKWLRIGCGAAALCAAIACRLTALTHPACWVCLGISLGCSIAVMLS